MISVRLDLQSSRLFNRICNSLDLVYYTLAFVIFV